MINKIKRILTYFGLLFRINNVEIKKKHTCYELSKDNKIIRTSLKHRLYLIDIANNFDYFFSAVEPSIENDKLILDYSVHIPQKVNGYDLHKIIFPSFPEPITTTKQYLDFAQLNNDSIVVDLGAYTGLTSILFDQEISKDNKNALGKVISVEPDIFNLSCLIQNIEAYKNKTNRNIEYIYAAISNKVDFEKFLADGSMGASLAKSSSKFSSLFRNSNNIKVPTVTLSYIAERFDLDRIDFIKCDIEGAETIIFNDEDFFKQYSPKIIIEAHSVNNKLTTNDVINTLKRFHYSCNVIEQKGSEFPLIECTKNQL